jgi:hypothetical protein
MADSIKVADARVDIKGGDAGLAKALAKATADVDSATGGMAAKLGTIGGAMTKTGAVVTAAGVGILGTLTGMVKGFADTADAQRDMALRTGLTVEAVGELKHAAEQSGTSIDDVEKGLKRMSVVLTDAAAGSKSAEGALAALGVSALDFQMLNTDQSFMLLAQTISEVEDPILRAAFAQDIFGKAGTQLLPLMLEGSKGIQAMRDEAQRLGIVVGTDAANAADQFNDNLDKLQKGFIGAGMQIAQALMPHALKLSEWLVEAAGKVSAWVQANPEMVASLAKWGVGIGAVLAVGGPLLMTIGGLLMAVGSIGPAVTAAGVVLAAFTGPVGLVIAGVAAVVAAGVALYKNWDQVKQTMGKLWDGMKGAFTTAWNAIGNTFTTAWNAIKGVFRSGADAIVGSWGWVRDKLGLIGTAIGDIFLSPFKAGWAAVQWLWRLFTGGGAPAGGGNVPPPGFRQSGGPVHRDSPYVVGERGPELLIPDSPGFVVSTPDFAEMFNSRALSPSSYATSTSTSTNNVQEGDTNISINIQSATIREQADIRKLAETLAEMTQSALRGKGRSAVLAGGY